MIGNLSGRGTIGEKRMTKKPKEYDMDALRHKLEQVKARLCKQAPFYGGFALSMPLKIVDNLVLGDGRVFLTAGTDGKMVMFHPSFVEDHTVDELIAVYAHEILHKIFKHPLRLRDRHPIVWNVACDFSINRILTDGGFKLPSGGCLDKKFDDKTEEQIYSVLMEKIEEVRKQNQKDSGQGDGNGDGQRWGEVIEPTNEDGSKMSDAEIRAEAQANDMMVKALASAAKMQGNLPGNLEDLIDKMLEPDIDYTDVIYQIMGGSRPSGYSMKRPNKSVLRHSGMYAAGRNKKGAGHIIFGMDVSGSISDLEAQNFLGIFNAVRELTFPETITVIQFDAAVTSVVTYQGDEEIPSLTIVGRGGTDFRPQFDYVEKNGMECDQYIVLTDLMGPFGEPPTGYPVTWFATTQGQAPWGRTIPFEVKQG
jgi:predicted metal-dependent peptidase